MVKRKLVIANNTFPTTQEMDLHMDITRLWMLKSDSFIIFFAAKDGEALYSQEKKKKKDLDLTAAQIMSYSLQNSGLN